MYSAACCERAVRLRQRVYPAVLGFLRQSQHHDDGPMRDGLQSGQHHGPRPGCVSGGNASSCTLRLLELVDVKLYDILSVAVFAVGGGGNSLLGG
jgi:hypothetical protein